MVWNRYVIYIVNSFYMRWIIMIFQKNSCKWFHKNVVVLQSSFHLWTDYLNIPEWKEIDKLNFSKVPSQIFQKLSWVRKCTISFTLWCVSVMFCDFKFLNTFVMPWKHDLAQRYIDYQLYISLGEQIDMSLEFK